MFLGEQDGYFVNVMSVDGKLSACDLSAEL